MNSQANFVERREHPRLGVMAQLEDITYSVLRKHGVFSEPVREAPTADPIKRWMLQKEDTTMANLRLVVSNDRPHREERYPRTWRLYKGNDTIEVHVTHDSHNRPFVLDRGAA
jgi:hypothetical protein